MTKEAIEIIKFLIPGFLSILIIDLLSEKRERKELFTIVIALVITVIVQPIISLIEFLLCDFIPYNYFGEWTENSQTIWSIFIGAVIGVLLARIKNDNDSKILKYLKSFSKSSETGNPSVWYSVFSSNAQFVNLHLKNNIVIQGYPKFWPSSNDDYFGLQQCSWVDSDDKCYKTDETIDITLIAASDVEFVEFVKSKTKGGNQDGQK